MLRSCFINRPVIDRLIMEALFTFSVALLQHRSLLHVGRIFVSIKRYSFKSRDPLSKKYFQRFDIKVEGLHNIDRIAGLSALPTPPSLSGPPTTTKSHIE